jgi:hypothetical protein
MFCRAGLVSRMRLVTPIHQVEALRGLLDHRPVALLALAQGLFGLLALGYVALVDHHAPHARIIQQVVEKEFGVTPGAVLVRHPELEGRVDPRLRPDLGERPSPLLEVIRAHVVEDAFAHQLLGRVARYPLYRGADVAYGAPGVDHRDDVRGVLHQGAEAPLALLKRRLMAFGLQRARLGPSCGGA